MNFINYLEIYLNEIRKIQIATGEWEDDNNKVSKKKPKKT